LEGKRRAVIKGRPEDRCLHDRQKVQAVLDKKPTLLPLRSGILRQPPQQGVDGSQECGGARVRVIDRRPIVFHAQFPEGAARRELQETVVVKHHLQSVEGPAKKGMGTRRRVQRTFATESTGSIVFAKSTESTESTKSTGFSTFVGSWFFSCAPNFRISNSSAGAGAISLHNR